MQVFENELPLIFFFICLFTYLSFIYFAAVNELFSLQYYVSFPPRLEYNFASAVVLSHQIFFFFFFFYSSEIMIFVRQLQCLANFLTLVHVNSFSFFNLHVLIHLPKPQFISIIIPVLFYLQPTEKAAEDSLMFPWKQREILMFEIPVHDSERAGLGE